MSEHVQKFSLPKCWKVGDHFVPPLPFLPPKWPVEPHVMGDAVSDAYDSMMAARATLWDKYEADNNVLGDDMTRYAQDDSNWDRLAPNMTQPDKTNCFNALSAMYTALASEAANITAAFNWTASGDADRQAGLNSQNAQQKIMLYNQAKSKYQNQATGACNTAEGAHTAVDSNGTTVETIESHWG